MWLVQYYASSEAAWRARRTASLPAADARPRPPSPEQTRTLGQVLPAAAPPASDAPPRGINVQRARALVVDGSAKVDRAANAGHFAKLLERMDSGQHAEPGVQFPLAAALRGQGLAQQAERCYQNFTRSRPNDAWGALRRGRAMVRRAEGTAPKAMARAPRADRRPHLDGKLDDPCWQRARPATLSSSLRDDGDWPAVAMLAYDDEFLYLAVDCRCAAGCRYEQAEGTRQRDADLSRRDRVDFYLDIDRDFTTCYRLSVDHRGWTSDDCWNDPSWNPRWYVAAAKSADSWRIEAAIPLAELAPRKPAARDVWVLGVQRTVPGVGFQSWTTPAAIAVMPEGFGYLIFE